MKMRSDPGTPLSVKLEQNLTMSNVAEETQFYEVVTEQTAEVVDEDYENDSNQMTEEELTAVSPSKKRRVAFPVSIKDHTDDDTRTIEYIINEEPDPGEGGASTSASTSEKQYVELIKPTFDGERERRLKRKSKAFGRYIGILMRDLVDDKVFSDAQNEILKIIQQASSQPQRRN
jgi:hypothetical protein